MQNFEQLGRELERRGKTDDLRALAQSPDGQKLGRRIDPDAIERAAKSGDGAALQSILKDVLGTDEGRRLAESVRKMMEE